MLKHFPSQHGLSAIPQGVHLFIPVDGSLKHVNESPLGSGVHVFPSQQT